MRFIVHYTIRSGIDNHVVHEGSAPVDAPHIEAIRALVPTLIEDDPHYDVRIHPYFEINEIDDVDPEEEEPLPGQA